MKKIAIFIFIIIPPVSIANQGYYLDEATGVRIVWALEDDMFPRSWLSARINAQAEPLSKEEIDRSILIVTNSLRKYPADLIKSNLKAVYVVHRLKFFGVSAAGTNYHFKVYIVNRGTAEGFTDDFIEKVFHAEFSSILFYNYKKNFDQESWKKINPQSFQYGTSGVNAIKQNQAGEVINELLLQKGFLSQYAQSTLENDFNSFAKNVFTADNHFWDIVRRYERIRKKLTLFINFYHSLDPVFNEEYFNNIQNKATTIEPHSFQKK